MIKPRSPFFLPALIAAAVLVAAGCRADKQPAGAPALTGQPEGSSPAATTDQAISQWIARLDEESIVTGRAGGRQPFYSGEFDRHGCQAADRLVGMGREAVAALRKAARGADPVARRNAAMALARLGDASAVEVLYQAAEQKNLRPVIRGQAILLLAELARSNPEKSAAIDLPRLMAIFHQRKRASDPSRHILTAIIRAAAVAGTPQGRNVVVGMLPSREPALRHAALEALREVELPETPPLVIEALGDRNPRIVLAAMALLAHRGGDEMAGRYARLLAGGDEKVRIEAVRRIGLAPGPEAGRLLLKVIDDPSLSVQREVIASAEKIGDASLLERALTVGRWRIRKAAVEALGRMKSAHSLGALAALTGDDSYNVRRSMAEAVGEIGRPVGAPIIVDLLADSASTVRAAAAESFARIAGFALKGFDPGWQPWKNAEAIKMARTWADQHSGPAAGDDPADSNAAAEGAVKIDLQTRTLIEALALPPGEHRQLAIAALVRMKERAIAPLEASVDARPPEIATAILDDVLPVIDPLYMALKKLRSEDVAVRRQAAIRFARAAKGRRLPEAAWQRARHVLSGETDGQVRRLLTERLFEAGDDALADALVHGLKLSDVRARQSAARYLGRLKSPKAVPHLVECLHDERTSVQFAAAWALGRIGDPAAVEPLKRALMTR
ncbi:MAG: hypothetical protein GWP05_03570, partial [Anaerolineaceae bacterium]|nr:hypothetical protein [Anaerolineaceae bacterium]